MSERGEAPAAAAPAGEMPAKKQKLSSDENSNPGDLSGDENVRPGEGEAAGVGGWCGGSARARAAGTGPRAGGGRERGGEGEGGPAPALPAVRGHRPPGAPRVYRGRERGRGARGRRRSQPTRLGSVAAPRGRWREAPVGETGEGLEERLPLCLHVGEGGFEAQTVSGLCLELYFKTPDLFFFFF